MNKTEEKPPICHMKPMVIEMADDWPNGQVTYWECKVCGHTKEISMTPCF